MTVAELLVAVTILAIAFVLALTILDRGNRVLKSGIESADMQQNTRIAFETMLGDIRMAGFDFDRDGAPAAEGWLQQVDEPIEYAGRRAITIRANFDHAESGAHSGREPDLEAPFSPFPIVTTHNDEIVTYALVSDQGANSDAVVFHADVTDGSAAARESYAAKGGKPEDTVTIPGVDLCPSGVCETPPYTLMRITLDGAGKRVMTPLADNIRSIDLRYFEDPATAALVIEDPGGGTWDPTDPAASTGPRATRGKIRAVRLTVRGMTGVPDPFYDDPNEPLESAASHRQYTLESLIAPRNLRKRGLGAGPTPASKFPVNP